MAALGGLGLLAGRLPFGLGGFVALYGGGFALAFAALALAFPRYAERRLAGLEA